MYEKLDYKQLKKSCDLSSLNFETTKDLRDNEELNSTKLIGQEKAKKAIKLGLMIKEKGYNIFAVGDTGTGRNTYAKRYCEEIAKTESVPEDLMYVYNFEVPKEPKLLQIKAGHGKEFRDDFYDTLELIENEVLKFYQDEELQRVKDEISLKHEEYKNLMIAELSTEVSEYGFGIKSTSSGIYMMPIIDGKIISEEEFDELEEEAKQNITMQSSEIQFKAQDVMRKIRASEKEIDELVDDYVQTEMLMIIGKQFSHLIVKYQEYKDVLEYILTVKEDIFENYYEIFVQETEEQEATDLQSLLYANAQVKSDLDFDIRYAINLLVDNSKLTNAPVIKDFNINLYTLLGDIEYDQDNTGLVTDFTKIKAGLLHKARGGYLILQASDVVNNALVYESLRKFLLTGKINLDYTKEHFMGVSATSIKPEPVDAMVKVVVVGSYTDYNLLSEYDEEFGNIFKIISEFDDTMLYSDDNVREAVSFILAKINKGKINHLTRSAVETIIEYSTKVADHKDKLTLHFDKITDILIEANAYAKLDGFDVIEKSHIDKAIIERIERSNLYELHLDEMIEDGTIIIDVEGEKVGQINGLTVIDMGTYTFGRPAKITATTYIGKPGIVNIEKEVDLSGSIHNKGVEVITGYLGEKYAKNTPLSFACSIAFEQNYSGVDGDSASSTELYAILSSLSGIPINQRIAVTGSVNQFGEIQAIGGVTEKIEGFFKVCKVKGVSDNFGVIIPKTNVQNLTLSDEVIEAVKEGKFTIHAISTIDEGIEILTGKKLGEVSVDGCEDDTISKLVFEKLVSFHEKSVKSNKI